MIRYQVLLECDYCHDREIIEAEGPLPEEWDWHPWIHREGIPDSEPQSHFLDFCCEGHLTAYLDTKEKRE